MSEAKNITYSEPMSGPSDLSMTFMDFFPDIPTGTINPGDTWIADDSVSSESASAKVYVKTKSENRYEGNEKINGKDCIKITSNLSGTEVILTQSEGTDVKVSGPFTGTAVIYFSSADGYFVKYSVTTKLKGIVDVLSMAMTIPIEIETTSDTNVIN